MPNNNLAALQKRIVAAKQTRKITRTMELIASSRLQRARGWLASFTPWADHMRQAARCLPDAVFAPPERPGCGRSAFVVLGGKKGLSGSYSPGLFQFARPLTGGQTVLAVGSAAADFYPDAAVTFGDELPTADGAAAITRAARALYDGGEVDEVSILYTHGGKHRAVRLFPPERPGDPPADMRLEPSGQALFPALLTAYTESLVFEAQLHAFVAEQMARVAAMDSATQNAGEIIDELQSTYNRIRQTAITQEIIMVGKATTLRKGHNG